MWRVQQVRWKQSSKKSQIPFRDYLSYYFNFHIFKWDQGKVSSVNWSSLKPLEVVPGGSKARISIQAFSASTRWFSSLNLLPSIWGTFPLTTTRPQSLLDPQMFSKQTFAHCSQRLLLEPPVSTGPTRPAWMFFTKPVTSDAECWREDAGDVFFWGPFHEGHTCTGVAFADLPRVQLRCCSTNHINRNLGRPLYSKSWAH